MEQIVASMVSDSARVLGISLRDSRLANVIEMAQEAVRNGFTPEQAMDFVRPELQKIQASALIAA